MYSGREICEVVAVEWERIRTCVERTKVEWCRKDREVCVERSRTFKFCPRSGVYDAAYAFFHSRIWFARAGCQTD